MPSIIHNRRVLSGTVSVGAVYDSEAQALFDRMTITPSSTRRTSINNFFVNIKNDLNISSLSTIFDCIWFTAAHDQQASRLNWVQNSSNLTEVNSVSWTLDRGYTDLTGLSYLDTNYNPATNGINYTRNNCSFGTYLRTERPDAAVISMGIQTAGFSGSQIYPRYAGNIFYSRVNSSDLANTASTSSAGLFTASRINATSHSEYKNGILLNTAVSGSLAVLSLNFFLLASNLDNSVVANLVENQIAFAYIANGSSVDQAGLYTRVQNYLTDLGAQI